MKSLYLTVFLSLFTGLLIYLGFRTEKTLVNQALISCMGKASFIAMKNAMAKSIALPQSIIFSLPGALWIFSITLLSKPFSFSLRQFQIKLFWLPLLLLLGFEGFQCLGWLNGVFDWMDVFMSLMFWVLALFLFRDIQVKLENFRKIQIHKVWCVTAYLVVYLAHVNV